MLSAIDTDSKDMVAYKNRFMVVQQANRSKADLIGTFLISLTEFV